MYDESGKRTRKITEQHDKDGGPPRKIKETFYIGSAYEIFRTYGGPMDSRAVCLEIENVSVMSGSDRVVMAEKRLQGGNPRVPSQLVRFQHANLQSSVTLELDNGAKVVSYVGHLPTLPHPLSHSRC